MCNLLIYVKTDTFGYFVRGYFDRWIFCPWIFWFGYFVRGYFVLGYFDRLPNFLHSYIIRISLYAFCLKVMSKYVVLIK